MITNNGLKKLLWPETDYLAKTLYLSRKPLLRIFQVISIVVFVTAIWALQSTGSTSVLDNVILCIPIIISILSIKFSEDHKTARLAFFSIILSAVAALYIFPFIQGKPELFFSHLIFYSMLNVILIVYTCSFGSRVIHWGLLGLFIGANVIASIAAEHGYFSTLLSDDGFIVSILGMFLLTVSSHYYYKRVADIYNASYRANIELNMLKNGLERQIQNRTAEIVEKNQLIELQNKKLRETSQTDALTGVKNRSFIEEYYCGVYEDIGKKGLNVAIIIVDIDDFKKVNDTLGHSYGDKVLKAVGKEISLSVRSADLVGRYGGEEFVILAEACKNLSGELAQRIRGNIELLEAHFPELDKLTVSIGYALSDEASSYDELFEKADKRLYQAKHQGKNIAVGMS